LFDFLKSFSVFLPINHHPPVSGQVPFASIYFPGLSRLPGRFAAGVELAV
jgi:hypothetical protein